MNSITIEQSPSDLELACHLHPNTAISSMRLSAAKLSSRSLSDTPESKISVTFKMKARSIDGPPGFLRFEVGFRMNGQIDEQERKPKEREAAVTVECTYEVDYLLREGFEPSDQEVKAFSGGNVIFNCWPYFREYLQDSIQRMGYPPFVAPFLRVQAKRPKSETEKATETSDDQSGKARRKQNPLTGNRRR